MSTLSLVVLVGGDGHFRCSEQPSRDTWRSPAPGATSACVDRTCVRRMTRSTPGGGPSLEGLVVADAGAGHLDDDGVVDESVDRGGRGHRILEDADPVAEDQLLVMRTLLRS